MPLQRGANVARAIGLALVLLSSPALADPQWHAAMSGGACWFRGADARRHTLGCGSASGHLLLGRQRDGDYGFGPYARVTGLWDTAVTVGAGASALVPLSATYPFIVSLGGALQKRGSGLGPGFEAWLFWGPSSYNFHSRYSMASGLLAGFQRTWGDAPSTTFGLAAQLDLMWLAVPVIALYEALRGPPHR